MTKQEQTAAEVLVYISSAKDMLQSARSLAYREEYFEFEGLDLELADAEVALMNSESAMCMVVRSMLK